MKPQRTLTTGVTESKALRRAYGAFATGVTVVTVGGDTPHGMTANSFASVSLDPPLLLVCVNRTAMMHGFLGDMGEFGVSVLRSGQESVARYFADARRPLGAEQFDRVDWLPGSSTGVPLITGALAHFECAVWGSYDGGDHTIFVGRLLSAQRRPDDEALLFMSGRFGQLQRQIGDAA